MSQRGVPFLIPGAIIVAGLLVSGAIVFRPHLPDLLPNNNPPNSHEDTSKPNPPVKPKSNQPRSEDLVRLKVEYSPPPREQDKKQVRFFIDGKYRAKMPPNQVSQTFEMGPWQVHELRWVVIGEDYYFTIATTITNTEPGESRLFFLTPPVYDNFFLMFANRTEKLEKGEFRYYLRKRRPDIRFRNVGEGAEPMRQDIIEGLKEFSNYEMGKVLNIDPGAVTDRHTWVKFPEYLGGFRELDAEELQILREDLVHAFDHIVAGNLKNRLLVSPNAEMKALELNIRENRNLVSDKLDRVLRALSINR